MNVKYWLEYICLSGFLGLFKRLCPLKSGKRFGALISKIGVRISKNRTVTRNIRNALNVDETTALGISNGMWNNLGRVLFEYPHLQYLAKNNVVFKGGEHIENLRDDGQGGVLFGAHLANWEIILHALLHHYSFAMHPVYRAPNNPMVDKKLHAYRAPDGRLTPYSKSKQGMIGMMKALKKEKHLGLLIDQKLNEGITAPFFGMNANTGTAFIDMAKKYDCPLVPIRCIRTNDGFIIEASKPIKTDGRETTQILQEVHTLLESWINEHPEQWLWLHRRWKNEELKHA